MIRLNHWRSLVRRLLGRVRFKTATMLIAIGVLALILAAVREYLSPVRVWRRGIHQKNIARRLESWEEARRGRIEGLDQTRTLDEVSSMLEDADDDTAARAVQVYPMIQPDSAEVARQLAMRLLDSDARVRRVAADSIRFAVQPQGEGREIAFPALIAALDDGDPGVRRTAARSLGAISFQVGHSESFDPRPALRRKLTDPDQAVRIAGALALARDGAGEEAVPMLLKSLEGHRENEANCSNIGCSEAIEALMVLAPRSDRATSGLIARVYREREGRSSETLTTLAALVLDDDPARERVVALAGEALGSTNADLRFSACLVLERVGVGRMAIPGLAEAFDRGAPRMRPYAEAALAKLARTYSEDIRRVAGAPDHRQETRNFLESILRADPNPVP
ncbi:HEAT repeat domain-containing protein [Tundrisphaera lichenicola]|uniref:HEAT repeat domain-containing protein n=1 Tax=Tundrisphaera lichenicola TaxID=2029860 RepID=UPI003EB74A53